MSITAKPRCLAALLCVVLVAAVAAVAGCGGGSPRGAAAGVADEDLTIQFAGYDSRAQLTYPATPGRHPAVVLIPGSGPEDLDGTVCSPTGAVLSHNFADIAAYLAPRGYAVLRYDKHGVTGTCRGSFTTPLRQLRQDAGRVLAAVERDPHVDRRRIFIFGWSEGSTVAAALARAHPELAGLVIQGGVVGPWAQIFSYQVLQVGIAYLRSLAPGGRVTPAVVARAASGPGGLVAKGIVRYVASPSSTPGRYAINARLDRNHDGALEIDSEVVPVIPRIIGLLLSPAGPLHLYAPGRALPVLGVQAAKLTLPVLLLQGRRDANVPPAGAPALEAALASRQKLLRVYPALGHSLGPASSLIADNFAPIAPAPLRDLAAWLAAHRG